MLKQRDHEIVTMIDRVIAQGAAGEAELLEGFVYGSLKIEEPNLERSTVTAAVRKYIAER